MTIFFSLLILAVVLLSIKRPSYGFGFFVAIRILVPEIVRTPGIESLSLNSSLILIVFTISIFKNPDLIKKIFTDKLSLVLLSFVSYALVTLPISDNSDLLGQFNILRQFAFTDILPIILAIVTINDKRDLQNIVLIYLISTIICCLYGIYTFLIGSNPYVTAIQIYYHYRDMYSVLDVGENSVGRGYGTSGTFVHANGFGYFISMSIPLCLYLIHKGYYKKMTMWTFILLLINMFLCKKRSPLVAMGSFFVLWMFFNREKNKFQKNLKILGMAVLGIVIIEVVPIFESIKNMVNTSLFFWNDNLLAKTDVGGSDMVLRVRQVFYPFVEVSNNIVFGHGFGWCEWYLEKYELHPILYGFETILSTAVCEFGIMGYLVYCLLFYKSYRYSRPFCDRKTNFQLLNIFALVILVIATGFNYFYFFGLVIVLMHKLEIFYYNYEKNINCDSHL